MWNNDYTMAEMNSLITNMLNYISEHTDEYYNCGNITAREELINIYTDFMRYSDCPVFDLKNTNLQEIAVIDNMVNDFIEDKGEY